MTQEERTQLEKDVLYAAHDAAREVSAQRVKLAQIGAQLESLGQALQHHPELVRPLPDPHSPYDYSKELNVPLDRQKIISLCDELRSLEQKLKSAEMRKGMLNL